MSFRKYLTAGVLSVAVAGVCMSVDRYVIGADNNPNVNGNPGDNANANPNTPEDQARMEKHFFQMAASDNTLEIRLAKLAEDRATDPQVKQAAQMMETDHQNANNALEQIAKKNNIDVSTDDLDDVDKAEYDAMDKEQGEMFTHMYVFGQVGDHARDELILAYHANKGKDDACREYASQTLPVVEKHLHMLEQIARPMSGLDATAQPAADTMTPNGMNANGR